MCARKSGFKIHTPKCYASSRWILRIETQPLHQFRSGGTLHPAVSKLYFRDGLVTQTEQISKLPLTHLQRCPPLSYVFWQRLRGTVRHQLIHELNAVASHPHVQRDTPLNVKCTNTQHHPGVGVSVETGRRVEAPESMAERAAPAVVQPRLVQSRYVERKRGRGLSLHRAVGVAG